MVRKLTPAQVKAAAIRYLNTTNYARFVLLPETK
jgi:predicted Zn-dependent peptidase